MNPARAGIVRAPEDYPWSSYKFYAYGKGDEKMEDEFGVKNLKNKRGRPARANK